MHFAGVRADSHTHPVAVRIRRHHEVAFDLFRELHAQAKRRRILRIGRIYGRKISVEPILFLNDGLIVKDLGRSEAREVIAAMDELSPP